MKPLQILTRSKRPQRAARLDVTEKVLVEPQHIPLLRAVIIHSGVMSRGRQAEVIAHSTSRLNTQQN